MQIQGADHDMLLLAHVFKLYENLDASNAAYFAALDTGDDVPGLDAGQLADIIVMAGLPSLVIGEDTPRYTQLASEYAATGAVVLVRMLCPDLGPKPLWHLVTSDHPGYFATLCLVEEPRAPYLGGSVDKHIAGGMVIIPCRCPSWHGEWDTLLPD